MKPAGFSALALLVLVSGCAPAYLPAPPRSTVTPPEQWRDRAGIDGITISQDWWKQFADPALGAAIVRAMANNSDVLAAAARIGEAEAQVRLAGAARAPTLSAGAGIASDRALSQVSGRPTEILAIQPQLGANWTLDLFGRLRALSDAARANFVASAADYDAVRLSVAGATAQAYLTLLSIDAQLDVTRKTLDLRVEARRIAEDRARLGYSSQLELTQAQSEYEAVAQAIPQLEQARRLQENGLRLLTGDLPGAMARGELANLSIPGIPALMPSELMRRRPDIAAAEARLAAADRTIASRRAEFMPDVALSASAGALIVDQLDYDPVSIWNIGASILAPLFQGGRLTAQVDQANARRDQAAYAYRDIVLRAFGEVENALTSEQRLREQIVHVSARRSILQRSLNLARDRYRGGYASYLDELDAQRNLFAVELNAITVREQQLNALVRVWASLGGGWGDRTIADRSALPR